MNNWRTLFPCLKQKVHDRDLVYLDSAATTLKPQSVIDAVTKHYTFGTANVHRGIHFLSSDATRQFEETRESARSFINAKTHKEVIFTKGTTDGLNLIANSYAAEFLKQGDVLLISTMEHHSNIVPWQLAAQKAGFTIKEIPVLDDGSLDMNTFKKLLDSENVKMISIVHVSNTLGTINPIEEIIKLGHQKGAVVCIDAAQSVAHAKVDVQKLDCDFLCFSLHKLFGPTGVGIMFGKQELLEKMPPYQGGGAMIKEVTIEKTTYNELPEKFEAGTPNIAGVIASKAAFDFMESLNFQAIHDYEENLLNLATEKFSQIEGLRIIGTAKKKCSVISFELKDVHPHDLGMLLDQQGIAIRTGHHCTQPLMKRFGVTATARASFTIYNNESDIDSLVNGINKAKELLS
ncbi:MAG: cysteine desulfurase CsdA [Bdellovibrio sp. CG_4_9_14_3_um_filter_39_7]|nr:MAG: cysteine desulfurase CsdA [Bdellovibrio sp. CG_4_9_14_3_um_filter_39_7]